MRFCLMTAFAGSSCLRLSSIVSLPIMWQAVRTVPASCSACSTSRFGIGALYWMYGRATAQESLHDRLPASQNDRDGVRNGSAMSAIATLEGRHARICMIVHAYYPVGEPRVQREARAAR